MLYMVIEHFRPEDLPAIYRRLAAHGRQLPPGLEYLDSWVTDDGRRCFQLMKTEEPGLIEAWTRAWADLVRFEVASVRTSREAALAATAG